MTAKDTYQGKSRRERALKAGRVLATAADVARLAGVSASAVSRTFTDGASVAPATREKVLAAAKTLKYRPNQMARSLMTNRSHIIGVAVTHIDNQFYPKVLEMLSEQLRLAGYRILLFVTRGSVDFDPALDELLRYRVDGLILASTSLSSALAEECRASGVPVIMFNNVDPHSTIPSVSGENYEGARTLAAFLHAGGHVRYGVVTGTADSSTSTSRVAGFCSYLKEHGLEEPVFATGNFKFDEAMAATRTLLSATDRPDALFCINDHMAMAAVQVAKEEFGLLVGRDISIVGFDDSSISAWPSFRLTTYSQPIDAMASRVIALLTEAIDGKIAEEPQVSISGELIVRGSARIPPADKWPQAEPAPA